VSAPQTTRNMWSLANKAVLEATSSHAIKSVDEMTPPKVGVVLARATHIDFEHLGVFVTKVTELCDKEQPSKDTHEFQIDPKSNENKTDPDHNLPSDKLITEKKTDPDHNLPSDKLIAGAPESRHSLAVKQVPELLYTMTVTDTHGLSYVTDVLMDEAMQGVVSVSSKVPMALYALRNITGTSHAFDNDVYEVKSLFETAFGINSACVTETDTPHAVGAAGSGIVRTFRTDVESPGSSVLGTESTTTSLFNELRVPTHTVVVNSARVSCSKPVEHHYIASQSVTIEEVGGIYAASIVMTLSAEVQGMDHIDDSVHMATPLVPFCRSDARTARYSVMHIFTAGRHFAADVIHAHDADAPRSLQLPVYAVMHAITKMDQKLAVDLIQSMSVGSMETLHTDPSTPMVVMRDSLTPMVALFSARLEKEGGDRGCMTDATEGLSVHDDVEWEQFLVEHARYGREQDTLRSQRKQYGTMSARTDEDLCFLSQEEEDRCLSPQADSQTDSQADEALLMSNYENEGEDNSKPVENNCNGDRRGDQDPETRIRGFVGTNSRPRDLEYPENVRMALMRHWNK
jgi:hypothetical protein